MLPLSFLKVLIKNPYTETLGFLVGHIPVCAPNYIRMNEYGFLQNIMKLLSKFQEKYIQKK